MPEQVRQDARRLAVAFSRGLRYRRPTFRNERMTTRAYGRPLAGEVSPAGALCVRRRNTRHSSESWNLVDRGDPSLRWGDG